MLKKLLLTFTLGLALVIGIGLTQPSTYKVSRSIVINAPKTQVFPYLNELKNWQKWSVWIERDPEMVFTYGKATSGLGAHQKWKSKSQGEGEITYTEVVPNELIKYDLHFTDWESTSLGSFTLAVAGNETEVTWSDEGKLSWNPVMRIMGRFFDKWIGEDFEAGLSKLKTTVEQKK